MATYTRAHLAERIEDAIQHNEEGKDGENGLQRSADYEGEKRPQNKAQGHGLLAADSIHEKPANDGAW